MAGETKTQWLSRAEADLKHKKNLTAHSGETLHQQVELLKMEGYLKMPNVTTHLSMKIRQELDDVLGSLDPSVLHTVAKITKTPTGVPTSAPTAVPISAPTTAQPTAAPTAAPTIPVWDQQDAPLSALNSQSMEYKSDIDHFTRWTKTALGPTNPFIPTPRHTQAIDAASDAYVDALHELEHRFQETEFKGRSDGVKTRTT
jgi:hypothetical protein